MTTDYSDFHRPPTVFIGLDPNCYSEEKEKEDMLGGSERFLLLVKKWLITDPYRSWWVHANTKINDPGYEYDIAIHSNSYMHGVKAKKHICFAGSLHSDAGWQNYNEVVNVSELMKGITKKGIVIPACVGNDIRPELAVSYFPNRIVCNANPHKWWDHIGPILSHLDNHNLDYDFVFCGGHKLYNPTWPESWRMPDNKKVHYQGILSRFNMIKMLSGGHVFILPAFTGDAPTFEVSPLESMKMGITTILPDRPPYSEVHKPLGAIMVDNTEQMAQKIIESLKHGRVYYDVSRYSEESVKEQWLKLLQEMLI